MLKVGFCSCWPGFVGVVNNFIPRSSGFSCVECILASALLFKVRRTRSSGIRYPSNIHIIKSSTNFRLLVASCGFGRDAPGMASQAISLIAIPCIRECKEIFSCCFAVMNWRASDISTAWDMTYVEVGLVDFSLHLIYLVQSISSGMM